MLWNQFVGPLDLVLFVVLYFVSTLGITVGFHRLLTHRAFATYRPIEYHVGDLRLDGGGGTGAGLGHRPPPPPRPRRRGGRPAQSARGARRTASPARCAGSGTAHLGWLFDHPTAAGAEKYAPDLLEDRGMRVISRLFALWAGLGLAIPFAVGWAVRGDLAGGFQAFFWAGLVRVFFVHHVTFSINSICHFFGQAPLPDRRLLDERVLARHPVVRRVLAPQPPRLPALRAARAALVGGGRRRPRDPGDAPARARLERGADPARAPSSSGSSRRPRGGPRATPAQSKPAPERPRSTRRRPRLRALRAAVRAARPPSAGSACSPASGERAPRTRSARAGPPLRPAWTGAYARSGAREPRRRPAASPGSRAGSPSATASSPSWRGARGAIRRAKCGSITAFVSACGLPAARTIVWQVAWCTAMPVLAEA